MAANDNKRYYWLKLEEDFFKRHDITIIESMPNGKDYILFYLKLLCESTSHEGYLRFSKTIPYSEEMLATITRTNIDVVRSAVKVFTELNMMQIMDDGTLYFEQVQKMIGSETGQTIRKREAKEAKNLIEGKVGVKNTQEIDIDIEKELEIDKDIELENKENIEKIQRKADSPASQLFQRLVNCDYESVNSIDKIDYIKFFEDWIHENGITDTKVKLECFINSVCNLERFENQHGQPRFSFKVNEKYKNIDNKFMYLKVSFENGSKRVENLRGD